MRKAVHTVLYIWEFRRDGTARNTGLAWLWFCFRQWDGLWHIGCAALESLCGLAHDSVNLSGIKRSNEICLKYDLGGEDDGELGEDGLWVEC